MILVKNPNVGWLLFLAWVLVFVGWLVFLAWVVLAFLKGYKPSKHPTDRSVQ